MPRVETDHCCGDRISDTTTVSDSLSQKLLLKWYAHICILGQRNEELSRLGGIFSFL